MNHRIHLYKKLPLPCHQRQTEESKQRRRQNYRQNVFSQSSLQLLILIVLGTITFIITPTTNRAYNHSPFLVDGALFHTAFLTCANPNLRHQITSSSLQRNQFLSSSSVKHLSVSLKESVKSSCIDNYAESMQNISTNIKSPSLLDSSTLKERKLSMSFHSPFLQDAVTTTTKTKIALVILNSPIQNPPSPIFQRLWNISNYRVCADGGANRLYDATKHNDDDNDDSYVPDLIKGDLDSLRPNVKAFYEMKSSKTKILRDHDQDTNDFDKALQSVKEWMFTENNSLDIDDNDGDVSTTKHIVYVYGAFGGRFDQEMASMQALYKWGDTFDNQIVLYNDETCAFLVPSDTHYEIHLPYCPDDGKDNELSCSYPVEGPTCGLIPLGCTCDSIKTTGLKWNLDGSSDSSSKFGGLVSTSNRVVEKVVTIESSHPIIFTAEMRCP